MTDSVHRAQMREYLSQQFSLTEEQIDSMLPRFISTLAGHMTKLEQVLDEGDSKGLGKVGHTLKGALLNLGLLECAELARIIEQHGKQCDTSFDYTTVVGQLREKIDRVTN